MVGWRSCGQGLRLYGPGFFLDVCIDCGLVYSFFVKAYEDDKAAVEEGGGASLYSCRASFLGLL